MRAAPPALPNTITRAEQAWKETIAQESRRRETWETKLNATFNSRSLTSSPVFGHSTSLSPASSFESIAKSPLNTAPFFTLNAQRSVTPSSVTQAHYAPPKVHHLPPLSKC